MNIPLIRLLNQQLLSPLFRSTAEVVDWMGAIQAQDLTWFRWAIGIRQQKPSLSEVERSFQEGRVVRAHVLRPTWHVVTAENLRWMLRLSRDSNERIYQSYLKQVGICIDEWMYDQALEVIGQSLEGGRSLTGEGIKEALVSHRLPDAEPYFRAFLWRAECRALVCNGPLHPTKPTYALVDEHIAPQPVLSREEALAKLTRLYFQSHAPATLNDFVWWSGLKTSEARQGIASLGNELQTEKINADLYYLHTSCRTRGRLQNATALLPAFDEYLIAYKDRTAVLPAPLFSKAFTNNGIFFPVVMHGGQVVGTWKNARNREDQPCHAFFREEGLPDATRLATAREQFLLFRSR